MQDVVRTETLTEEERKEYKRLQKKLGCKFGIKELEPNEMEIEVVFRVNDFRPRGKKSKKFTYPLTGIIPDDHREKISEELKQFCDETFSDFTDEIIEVFKRI